MKNVAEKKRIRSPIVRSLKAQLRFALYLCPLSFSHCSPPALHSLRSALLLSLPLGVVFIALCFGRHILLALPCLALP